MIQDHSAFIAITSLCVLLIIGITMVGLNGITGYAVASNEKIMYCEPLTCAQVGLESAGIFECNEEICYRHCKQNGYLIERAVFCEK